MRGQVWVETVIYTLIGLSLIGLVLSLVMPRIQEYQDRAVIDQTMGSFNLIDGKMTEVLRAPFNTRIVQFTLKKGTLIIDAENDQIQFVFDEAHVEYSEPGESVELGRVMILTEKHNDVYRITLTLPYSADIQLANEETEKRLSPASTPYRLSFENQGLDEQGREIIFAQELNGG